MFHAGNEITKIDLSNFDTSNVKSMQGMFFGCSSLTSLNLTNFDISNVINMDAMFQYCSTLTSLDLSHFKTSNVKNMGSMFLYCSSLTSFDLSNFITSNVEDMSNMFADCHNLEYISLNYLNEYKLGNSINQYEKIFDFVPENIVICIKEEITKDKIFPQIKIKTCCVIDCSNDWKSKQKKIIHNTNECIEIYDNSGKEIIDTEINTLPYKNNEILETIINTFMICKN